MSLNLELLRIGAGTTPVRAPGALTPTQGPADSGAKFGEALVKALDEVDQTEKAANVEVQKVVKGESTDLHNVMMALEKADVSVRLMTQVGRKAIEAYKEVMRMSV